LFKFAFVRNTWDRLVSLYEFQRSRKFRQSDRHWTCKFLKNFPIFIEHLVFDSKSNWPDHNHQQLARLKRPVNFIGCYERLADDWKRVCLLAEMPHVPLERHNYTQERKHYSEYYDKRLRALVQEHYTEEIERFHFRYED